MQFITGQSRQQTYFATLEEQVSSDNPVRLMDAFIDKLDFQIVLTLNYFLILWSKAPEQSL